MPDRKLHSAKKENGGMSFIAAFKKKFNIKRPYVLYCGRRETGKGTPLMTHYLSTFRERYPQVKLKLDVDDSLRNQRGMTKYLMVVAYDYQFDGKQFTGSKIKLLPTEASDPRKLKKKIEAYAEGTNTICYVNPETPTEAVLKKNSKAALYSIWFPFLFIIGGLGMILSALFRKN
jgi:hypothetical protein